MRGNIQKKGDATEKADGKSRRRRGQKAKGRDTEEDAKRRYNKAKMKATGRSYQGEMKRAKTRRQKEDKQVIKEGE